MIFPSFGQFKNPITVDLHSHLLPAIDDGVKTIDESIKIIKKFKELGYKKLIITPHIMSHMYPNTKNNILGALDDIRSRLNYEKISITLEASAEYYLDQHFLDLLSKKDILPFHHKYILFETTYQSKPMILIEAIFEMQAKGYIPVLAHPERYLYLHNNMEQYLELKDLGVLFQTNVKSLKSYSSPVSKMAHKLINMGLVDFMGSDVHRVKDIQNFEKLLKTRMYKNIFKKNTILNNTL